MVLLWAHEWLIDVGIETGALPSRTLREQIGKVLEKRLVLLNLVVWVRTVLRLSQMPIVCRERLVLGMQLDFLFGFLQGLEIFLSGRVLRIKKTVEAEWSILGVDKLQRVAALVLLWIVHENLLQIFLHFLIWEWIEDLNLLKISEHELYIDIFLKRTERGLTSGQLLWFLRSDGHSFFGNGNFYSYDVKIRSYDC